MAQIGYGQMKEQLFDKVQQLVIHLNIKALFKDNRSMEMWYRLFMAHYPELAWKQQLLLSTQHASMMKEHLYAWFDELKTYMEESAHGYILELLERIFNADETGFPLAPKPLKVITVKGELHIYQQGTSSKTQIICLMAHNAVGHYI